jgi:hypothetical protein
MEKNKKLHNNPVQATARAGFFWECCFRLEFLNYLKGQGKPWLLLTGALDTLKSWRKYDKRSF